jgi:hypothetical protein
VFVLEFGHLPLVSLKVIVLFAIRLAVFPLPFLRPHGAVEVLINGEG